MIKRSDKNHQRFLILAKRLHFAIHGRDLAEIDQLHWVRVLKSLKHDVKDENELLAVISWFCCNPMKVIKHLEGFHVCFLEVVNQYRDSLLADVPKKYADMANLVMLDMTRRVNEGDGHSVFYGAVKLYEKLKALFDSDHPISKYRDMLAWCADSSAFQFLEPASSRFAAKYLWWAYTQNNWKRNWNGRINHHLPKDLVILDFLDAQLAVFDHTKLSIQDRADILIGIGEVSVNG